MRPVTMARRLGVIAAFVALASTADATPSTDPCLTAPVEGQKLRRAGKLLEARRRFTICGRTTCPREVVQACTGWAHEIDASVPTVVLSAQDDSGRDVTARVSVDGSTPEDVSGRAFELDPGEHRFAVEKEGYPSVEQRVMIREGEKNRVIVATFATPKAPVAPAAPPRPEERDATRRAEPREATSWWTPMRATGAITGSVGAAAVLTGLAMAGMAKLEHGSARDKCRAVDDCPHDAVQSADHARSLADVATITVIAGGGLALVGTALMLLASSPRDTPRASGRRSLPVGIAAGLGSLGVVTRW